MFSGNLCILTEWICFENQTPWLCSHPRENLTKRERVIVSLCVLAGQETTRFTDSEKTNRAWPYCGEEHGRKSEGPLILTMCFFSDFLGVCSVYSSIKWGLYLPCMYLGIFEIIKWAITGSTLKKYKYTPGYNIII